MTEFQPPYILAIDQGTTSSRAVVFDQAGDIVSSAQAEFEQHYPRDGWVEHDPEEIWATTLATAREAFAEAEKTGGEVAAIGVTNQRETTILWDRKSGAPLYNAIVWQDRRTAARCAELREEGFESNTYEGGIQNKIAEWLKERGWYAEWEDAGTLCLSKL